MRVGYPCINRGIGCSAGRTFRLNRYSDTLLREKVAENLDCLERIIDFNIRRNLMFFRISSDTIPFASHPVCRVDWAKECKGKLRRLGGKIRRAGMRISMHPDQFVVINALRRDVVRASVRELAYHARLLDAMELGQDARIQIHLGGLYGDRRGALERFVTEFARLPKAVRERLAVENDDRRFSLADCMSIHERSGTPVIVDNLHHQLLNRGETLRAAMKTAARTWTRVTGPPMVDYSCQMPGGRPGRHAETLDDDDFIRFLTETVNMDFDLMLEIKDKEISALRALKLARSLGRKDLAGLPRE